MMALEQKSNSINNNLAPIILFVFNRPDHTRQTIEALQKNQMALESELFVFCDGPRCEKDLEKINQVYQVIDNVNGFKKVVVKKSALNKGLANSVINGVGEILDKYGRAIILEDDIVTASDFLVFMNRALDFYNDDERVFEVAGFNYSNYKNPKNYLYSVFPSLRSSSWGWATWKNRWDKVDFAVKDYDVIKNNKKIQKEFRKIGDNLFEMLQNQIKGKIDSWAIRVCWHMFKNKLYCIYPTQTLVKNIGMDSTGVHCHTDLDAMNFDLTNQNQEIKFMAIEDMINCNYAEREFLKYTRYSFVKKFFISRKKKTKLKYILLGIIIAETIRFLIV